MSIFKVLVPILITLLCLIGFIIYSITSEPKVEEEEEIKKEETTPTPSSIQDRRDALKNVFK